MISVERVVKIHDRQIQSFGGAAGIRDLGALESALQRPFQTFDGIELYPTHIEKAAALIESFLINHPFVDGNKRTGYVLMRVLLKLNGMNLEATMEEKYSFVISVADGSLDTAEITEWLSRFSVKL